MHKDNFIIFLKVQWQTPHLLLVFVFSNHKSAVCVLSMEESLVLDFQKILADKIFNRAGHLVLIGLFLKTIVHNLLKHIS